MEIALTNTVHYRSLLLQRTTETFISPKCQLSLSSHEIGSMGDLDLQTGAFFHQAGSYLKITPVLH